MEIDHKGVPRNDKGVIGELKGQPKEKGVYGHLSTRLAQLMWDCLMVQQQSTLDSQC